MKITSKLILCMLAMHGFNQINAQETPMNQDEIIEKYLKNGAWNHHYLTKEWADWIDKGIEEDSTIAYLWQQKALPYWKQKKYQLAIGFYNKAVTLDRKNWLSRRGFLKCIFAKDYLGAISDFEAYKKDFGSTYEQDHSLDFYIGICYLQLNQFDQALNILYNNIEEQTLKYGEDWPPYLDRYYLAIAYFEKDEYKKAIHQLDLVLKIYPNFSDAQFYKSICLHYLGENEEAVNLMTLGKSNFNLGYTFNEDSNPYENYPYQITWQWKNAFSMIE